MNNELIEKEITILKKRFAEAHPMFKNEIGKEINTLKKILQKAKEEQPKDVEEFYKKWSSDCRILPKEHEAIHSHEDLLRFAKDFANSRKEVTDEEIYSHVNQYYEFDDNMNDYMSVYAEGAKWMRKQLNK